MAPPGPARAIVVPLPRNSPTHWSTSGLFRGLVESLPFPIVLCVLAFGLQSLMGNDCLPRKRDHLMQARSQLLVPRSLQVDPH
jgi:hypothetical protein